MMNSWPSRSESHCPIRRATMSPAPAGAVGTMMRTWSRRIGLRPNEARPGRQRGSARGQMQKISAGKFHFEPPFTSFDHLVVEREQPIWHFETERLRGLEIRDELEARRPLRRQLGHF